MLFRSKFFPPVVTGTVVLAIGLSLIGVGVNSFAGGSGAKDFGSLPNLLLGLLVLIVIVALKHFTKGLPNKRCARLLPKSPNWWNPIIFKLLPSETERRAGKRNGSFKICVWTEKCRCSWSVKTGHPFTPLPKSPGKNFRNTILPCEVPFRLPAG